MIKYVGKKRKTGKKSIRAVMLLIICISAAALLFSLCNLDNIIFRDKTDIKTFQIGTWDEISVGVLEDKLVCVSTNGISVFDENGETVDRLDLFMDKPAAVSGKNLCAVWDTGTDMVYTVSEDGIDFFDAGGAVLFASAEDGMLAAVTDNAEYQNSVTVCNCDLERILSWNSADNRVFSARLSGDGKMLAAVTEAGVHLFDCVLGKEQAALDSDKIYDAIWLNDDCICAVSTQKLIFFDSKLNETASFEFGTRKLLALDVDDVVAIALEDSQAHKKASIVTIDAYGNIIGSTEVSSKNLSVNVFSDKVLVACEDNLKLYNAELRRGRTVKNTESDLAVLVDQNKAAVFSGDVCRYIVF